MVLSPTLLVAFDALFAPPPPGSQIKEPGAIINEQTGTLLV